MKKDLQLLRRLLLNQIYMMRHMNKVIQRENDSPITNSENLYLATFESASATLTEQNIVAAIDKGLTEKRTPLNIKFSQQVPGIHSFGIINNKQVLMFNYETETWHVNQFNAGITGCKLIVIGRGGFDVGDIIYSSNDSRDNFRNLSSYYLYAGKEKYVAWGAKDGVNVWATLGNYLWKVEF